MPLEPDPKQRGKCPECRRFFDPPVSQCPTCAVPLRFPYLQETKREALVEEVGKIIDPEAWGLPPTIEVENDYHDRETARDKARAIIAWIAALNLIG